MMRKLIPGMLAGTLLIGQTLIAGGGGQGGIDDPNVAREQVYANMAPELWQQFQEMDQLTDQVLANMRDAGEDSDGFRDAINAHMSAGTLDVAGVEQDLVTRGYMTPAIMTQINNLLEKMQVGMRQAVVDATYARIKQLLLPTEEEWAVLEPKIRRVLDAQATLRQPGERVNLVLGVGGAMGEGPMSPGMYFISQLGATQGDTELDRARQALQAAIADRQMNDAALASKLATWRGQRDKARAQLAAAQENLTRVVTLRQEAVLIIVGVL